MAVYVRFFDAFPSPDGKYAPRRRDFIRPRVPVKRRAWATQLDDTLKVTSAMVANLFLLLAVNIISALEAPLFGGHPLSFTSLAIYDILTLGLIAYYGLLIAADKLDALLILLARAVQTDMISHYESTPGQGADVPDRKKGMSGHSESGPGHWEAMSDAHGPDTHGSGPGIIRRVTSNLWVPTTFNFTIVAGLIYASGGIAYSPYFPVPLAMMAIGQCLYRAPAIELGSGSPAHRLVAFVRRMVGLYRYPLCMVTFLLVALERLQEVDPLVTKPAPTAEIVITTLLSLFATMCVTFITRRADQATAAPGGHA